MPENQEKMKKILEQFQQAAKSAGVKITPQRLEVFCAVANSVNHPSADEIHRQLLHRLPTITLDTVYRTLWLLCDLGLIEPVSFRQGSIRFDANCLHHHHFTCLHCGLIRDFTSDCLSTLPIPVEVNEFGRGISLNIEIKGVCEACLKAGIEPGPNIKQLRKKAKRSKS